jgi:hypothetical protein
MVNRIFILSPARTGGKRSDLLFNERANFDLATRLRQADGVPLGEVFSFLSGLYFRGKLAYANHFGRPPAGSARAYVITSDAGLLPAEERVNLQRLRQFATVPIDPGEPQYSRPLCETATALHERAGAGCEAVLLGSIATDKYVGALQSIFGQKLLFPAEFVGRGDMSRGGLMLRAVRENAELAYVSLSAAASRRGKRPPKLAPLPRTAGQSAEFRRGPQP